MSVPASTPSRLTATQWLICIIASIGFAFDTYELLMLPLVLPPALPELTGFKPGSPEFQSWVGIMFYVPAFAGGIFGLLGGYLTDRLGRRRVLTGSILLYALSAFAAGYSTSICMLLLLRSTTFIGVCVEFVAAVAWLAELFDDPQQREKVLGYTQALFIRRRPAGGRANHLCVQQPPRTCRRSVMPEFLQGSLGSVSTPHAAWRYTLMSGLIPAIPLIVIRPFLPESPLVAKQEGGRHAQATELCGVVRAVAAADDDRDHDHVRVQLWRAPSGRSSRFRKSCRACRK